MAAFENQKVVAKAAIQSVNKEAYEAMKQMMGKLGLEVNEDKAEGGRMEGWEARRPLIVAVVAGI